MSFSAKPVVIGGNGHSGTRIFLEVLEHSGISCGFRPLARRSNSEDLRIIGFLNRWVEPYLRGQLDTAQLLHMKRALKRRLRLFFPFRRSPWAFKNPRHMLILPLLHDLFPDMKFVHVIRDGRDIALGNPFVATNRYLDAFLETGEHQLPPEQKMILFWGRSNERAMRYGREALGENYSQIRWEDLCGNPEPMSLELIRFAGGDQSRAASAARKVRKPASIGRWSSYPSEVRDPVVALGAPWLKLFRYLD
jgi:hypothetical protein